MKRYRQNGMGLIAKRPAEFNIDMKLRPQDPLILFIDGERISKSVASWIEIAPNRIWDKIYGSAEYGGMYNVPVGKEVPKLSLCSNALSLLKKAIEKSSPDRIEALEKRKKFSLALSRMSTQFS